MIDEANRLRLPKRLGRLDELAHNLWWSWHPQARDLFRILDYPLWRTSGYNPVKLLRDIDPDKLKTAAHDPAFLTLYDFVMAAFDADMAAQDTWFATRYPDAIPGPISLLLYGVRLPQLSAYIRRRPGNSSRRYL